MAWQGQWELNAWPNFMIIAAVLVIAAYLTWKRGRSPLEIFSAKADSILVASLRRRFGMAISN